MSRNHTYNDQYYDEDESDEYDQEMRGIAGEKRVEVNSLGKVIVLQENNLDSWQSYCS